MTPKPDPAVKRTQRHPLLRSRAGVIGLVVILVLVAACVGSLPFTMSSAGVSDDGQVLPARYKHGELSRSLMPPSWAPHREDEAARRSAGSASLLGTDKLGRDLLTRCLAGGGVSIGIGAAAAGISVLIGTLYGALAGYVGGRADAIMMRIVDVLYGLPSLLLVVLLAVAGDAVLSDYVSRRPERERFVQRELAGMTVERREAERALVEEAARGQFPARELSETARSAYEIGVLLVAIGGLSWLTMSRVIRGQVLSLKEQSFMEAARAIGVPAHRQFVRHLLPNLTGTIVVYATLTMPQAMLQESFLSFLGIGVRAPLPSWGNLASEGLVELNPVRNRWWLVVFPCGLLAVTLVALNFVGEGLREAFDPRKARK